MAKRKLKWAVSPGRLPNCVSAPRMAGHKEVRVRFFLISSPKSKERPSLDEIRSAFEALLSKLDMARRLCRRPVPAAWNLTTTSLLDYIESALDINALSFRCPHTKQVDNLSTRRPLLTDTDRYACSWLALHEIAGVVSRRARFASKDFSLSCFHCASTGVGNTNAAPEGGV